MWRGRPPQAEFDENDEVEKDVTVNGSSASLVKIVFWPFPWKREIG